MTPMFSGARSRVVALGLATFLALAGATLATLWWRSAEDLAPWRAGAPPHPWSTWLHQEAHWREQGLHREPENVYVPLTKISPQLQLAVLVSEDIDYLGHGAVDPRAMWEAIRAWWRGGRLRGASTISQQLAKTLFLTGERSISRKLVEARIAWQLEHELGKRRILELYLNVVEFGPGLLGAEAAARHYFGVEASQLDAVQAASLAAAIPAPGRDNPTTRSRRWSLRCATILERMPHAEWLRRQLASLDESPARR
jgi:monofunctional glycosyltransferase